MVLNWNIGVIADFIIATLGLIVIIISYLSPKSKKIPSLFFIRLGFIFFWIYMLFDGLAILLINEVIIIFSGLLLIPMTIFITIGITYTIKETLYSKGLLVICGLSILFIYIGMQPGATKIGFEAGYLRVDWAGFFNIIAILFTCISVLYLFYWGTKTWLNAPFLIKKEASIFFMGILFICPLGLLFYLLYLFETFLIIVSDFMVMIGALIFIFSLLKEPKLLYILPFTIHRIVVKDRNGHPLYDHDWSETNITETIFTGFLNAVQLMSKEVMHIGGLLDINLEEGILILKESKNITVGLVASKTSKLLRDSVIKFTDDFETKFERELKNSVRDMAQYDGAFELIEKYFSNFPYKIIKSKKQPLLLTGEYVKIPLELENKLRKIFPDEEEYKAIKTELIKSPLSFTSEFTKLYNDLKDEIEKISDEEMKYLDENNEIKKQ
jgi:hypothetical protein